jgi:hypothetical protein
MRIRDGLREVRALARDVRHTRVELESAKLLLGQLLSELHRVDSTRGSLQNYEFSVFSQWGEDGIIQHLIHHVDVACHTFIEFGVEDFRESNCRFLLENDNWQGFVLDASESNIRKLQSTDLYWRRPLDAKAAFITRETVNTLLAESGFDRGLGILSIDVDGIDYHLLEALPDWKPSIVIVEYNAVFGADRAVTVPYSADFVRLTAHPSGLYAGASLPAFVHLLEGRGYSLVGVNRVGNNAFFVRSDLCNDAVRPELVKDVFRESTFRESRDADGALTFLRGSARRSVIADLPLLDVQSGEHLRVRDLP